jgi:hypothetical protein
MLLRGCILITQGRSGKSPGHPHTCWLTLPPALSQLHGSAKAGQLLPRHPVLCGLGHKAPQVLRGRAMGAFQAAEVAPNCQQAHLGVLPIARLLLVAAAGALELCQPGYVGGHCRQGAPASCSGGTVIDFRATYITSIHVDSTSTTKTEVTPIRGNSGSVLLTSGVQDGQRNPARDVLCSGGCAGQAPLLQRFMAQQERFHGCIATVQAAGAPPEKLQGAVQHLHPGAPAVLRATAADGRVHQRHGVCLHATCNLDCVTQPVDWHAPCWDQLARQGGSELDIQGHRCVCSANGTCRYLVGNV